MPDVDEVFAEHQQLAQTFMDEAQSAISQAAAALSDRSIYAYQPFQFQSITWALGGPDLSFDRPARPADVQLDVLPDLIDIPTDMPNLSATFTATPPMSPILDVITKPNDSPPSDPGPGPSVSQNILLPTAPILLPLPSSTLPYPILSVPTAPVWNNPVFTGTPPADIDTPSVAEYMQLLDDSYTRFSQLVPEIAQSNWQIWYATLLQNHPLLTKLVDTISSYIDTGGAGIPTAIEDAIVTRAESKINGDQRRATIRVYDEAAKRGLWMPSGALQAGLKEARQMATEAKAKVVTDLAVEHLKLEQGNMQFMLKLGHGVEELMVNSSIQLARIVTELNGQAIEITKLTLNGMIEINNIVVKIYLAKWEGYKAAVEVYRAQIMAIEAQVRLYEAEIRAELAKNEINKAHVEILTAVVNANNSLVNLYKARIEGETAKLEIDRVRAQIYEAQVRGYVGRIEGYKARWSAFESEVRANLATAQVYESEVRGYVGQADAFRAQVGAYEAQVRAVGVQTDAIARINEANLRAWTAKADGMLRAFSSEMQAYATEWQAAVEQVKVRSSFWAVALEQIRGMNNSQIAQDSERGREHLTQWQGQLEGALRAAEGLTHFAAVVSSLAQSTLSGVTSFAGLIESKEQ